MATESSGTQILTGAAMNMTMESGLDVPSVATHFELALGIIGVIGNGIVCIIIPADRQLRTMTNYFLLSLSFADLLTSVFLIFNRYINNTAVPGVPGGVAGQLYCRMWNSQLLFWFCIKASVFNLVAVTLERYRFLTTLHRPSGERRLTEKTAGLMIFLAWFIAFVLEAVYVFFHKYDGEGEGGACDFAYPSNAVGTSLGVISFLATYFFPLLIMTWSYLHILKSLKERADTLRRQHEQIDGPAFTLLTARKKMIRVLIVVFVAFVFCWTPNQLLFLCFNLGVNSISYSSAYYNFFVLLAFSNSVINPIIYVFTYRQFRRGFLLIFCPRLAQKTNKVFQEPHGGESTLEIRDNFDSNDGV